MTTEPRHQYYTAAAGLLACMFREDVEGAELLTPTTWEPDQVEQFAEMIDLPVEDDPSRYFAAELLRNRNEWQAFGVAMSVVAGHLLREIGEQSGIDPTALIQRFSENVLLRGED